MQNSGMNSGSAIFTIGDSLSQVIIKHAIIQNNHCLLFKVIEVSLTPYYCTVFHEVSYQAEM